MRYTSAQPYIAAFVILGRDRKAPFLMRSNTAWMNGYYGLPAGKIEKGESFTQGMVREALEEAGVTIKEQDLKYLLTVHRKADDYTDSWVDIYFEATEWIGEPNNTETARHSELAWLDLDNLPENVLPNQVFALQQIAQGNTYAEYDWE